MAQPLQLHFEYAIKFSNGTYYNGRKDRYTPSLVTLPYCGPYVDAYTYTERGAYSKIDSNPLQFKDCVVERRV